MRTRSTANSAGGPKDEKRAAHPADGLVVLAAATVCLQTVIAAPRRGDLVGKRGRCGNSKVPCDWAVVEACSLYSVSELRQAAVEELCFIMNPDVHSSRAELLIAWCFQG